MLKDKIEIYSHPEDHTQVKKTWSCKALIVEKKWSVRHILLVPSEHDGNWSIPGGSMKEWERDTKTLSRECSEELWLPHFRPSWYKFLRQTEQIFRSPKDNKWRHKVYMWYVCSLSSSTAIGKWRYFSLTEAEKVLKDFEKEILQSLPNP